jgi:hypothetical protein
MREARYVSLIPRTTLHSDSEQEDFSKLSSFSVNTIWTHLLHVSYYSMYSQIKSLFLLHSKPAPPPRNTFLPKKGNIENIHINSSIGGLSLVYL